jgi:dolichyl-phosphate-mannose-protein mannosyltransferase
MKKFFKSSLANIARFASGRVVSFLFLILLILGVVTRLVPPSYPLTGLVFDEAYFVPQVESYVVNRYFFDMHPPLAKMLMYYSTLAINPDAAQKLDPEKLANKVDNYQTPLDLAGIRLAPKIFGSLLPAFVFLLALELLCLGQKQRTSRSIFVAFGIGVFAVFSNIIAVESRFGLQTPFLLLFMCLTLFAAAKYFNAKQARWQELWFIFTCIALGLAVSVKWLALSVLPAVLLLVLIRELFIPIRTYASRRRQVIFGIWTLIQRGIFMGVLALLLYAGFFYWHFNMFKFYSPAAYEVSEQYQSELKGEGSAVSFVEKFLEWHRLSVKYSEHVPALDYGKSDEIGSMWVTWPIMARPISYYWQTDGNGIYQFIYLIGNPLLWVFSLLGAFALSGIGFSRLFAKNNFKLQHFLIIMLYFANWLPFALIPRVMYLYHFVPGFLFGLFAFGMLVHDFVYPRAAELYQKYARWHYEWLNSAFLVAGLATLILVMGAFFYYAPFTYLLPLSKDEFHQRVLLKEWNMKWPGGE